MVQRALIPLGLFALALLIRLLTWPTVIERGRVVFFGMDAWYHMRRVQLALAGSGWPPSFDPYLNFPHGAQPIWSPFFDAFVAGVVWPFHLAMGPLAVERVATLVPPVLGAACVVLVYQLALRLFDRQVALASGLLLSFLSAHYWYSQIGFVDHHVAVALAATALLLSAIRVFEAPTTLRWATTGLLAGFCLLLWPGMLFHVGLLELSLWAWCVTRERAREAARGIAVMNGVALGVVLPFGAFASWQIWSSFSPAVVSHFQPWMFAALTLHAGICWEWWSRGDAGFGARVACVAFVGVALLAASAFVFPELLRGLDEARQWLAKDEVFQGLVRESRPLFMAEAGFDRENAELRLSRFLYLLPVVLWALARHARTSRRRPALLFLCFWVFALAALTLLQRRFFNSLSPGFALVMAWGGVSLWRARPDVFRADPRRRLVAVGLAVVVGVGGFAPMAATYRGPLANLMAAARGAPMTVPKHQHSRRVLINAAIWMRDNTPPTAGLLDPTVAPEYGVLALWGYGHLIKYLAQRPTVAGNFGDDVGEVNLRRVTAYFASREPDAVRILEDLRARYVLVRTLGDVPPERLLGGAMQKRMSVDDSPGLARHRLIYESPLSGDWAAIGRSEYRIFERVEGARIVGRAPPGAEVHAKLEYESNRGRRGRYQSAAVADAAGRYEIRVPYASRSGLPGVRPDGPYRLSAAGVFADLIVDERAVQGGIVIEGPDLW